VAIDIANMKKLSLKVALGKMKGNPIYKTEFCKKQNKIQPYECIHHRPLKLQRSVYRGYGETNIRSIEQKMFQKQAIP
jgi:hypothetical protein